MNSETLGKLADALAKAQGMMENAAKDKENPFFKSSYADLASVWDACRIPLSKNGLSVIQTLSMLDGKLMLNSKLIHASGEWIDSVIPIQPVKYDPQSIGSTITYMRRFSLSALVGIAAAETDDDGNQGSGRDMSPPPKQVHKMSTFALPKEHPESSALYKQAAVAQQQLADRANVPGQHSGSKQGLAEEMPPWAK